MNQRLPSGPAVMLSGPASDVGSAYSVTDQFDVAVACVNLPILLVFVSVNQTVPSGKAAIPRGPALALGIGSCPSTKPAVLTHPILLASVSTNQMFPSGAVVIPFGERFGA